MRIIINEKKKFTFKVLSLVLIFVFTVEMVYTDVFAATATASKTAASAVIKRGNTTSNLFNGGCMAYDTEWFYYVSGGKQKKVPVDFSVEYKGDPPGIFAKRLDDTGEPRRLTDTQKQNFECVAMSNLNVVDGWIYYKTQRVTKRDPEMGFVISTEDIIARNKTDGSGSTQVIYASGDSSNKGLAMVRFMVVDDWIYYSVDGIENDDMVHYIYRMRTDGKGKVRLVKTTNTYFDVNGDWLYFEKYGGSYGSIIVRKKLTEANKIESVYSPPFNADKFFIEGNWIYLKANNIISRVPLKKNVKYSEVKELVKISGDRVTSDIVMVVNGWLYYDLSEVKYVKEGEFTNPQYTNTLYRIQVDGKNKKKVCSQEEFCYRDMQSINSYLYSPLALNSPQPMTIRLKISELK